LIIEGGMQALVLPKCMDDLLLHYFFFLFGLMAFSCPPGVIAASINAEHLALYLAGKVVRI
jgi:hypothetical protein